MYIPIKTLKKHIPNNDYNRWACDMLEFISKNHWREESETYYFIEFYKKIIDKYFINKKTKWKSDKKQYAQDPMEINLQQSL